MELRIIEPRHKTQIEKMAEGVVATVDSIKKVGKKIGNLFKRKTKESTVTATQTAIVDEVSTQTITVDTDRELVLPALAILGDETKEKITFLKQLHVLSEMSMRDIAEGLKCILETEMNVEYLLNCSMEDAVVLLKIWKLGRLSGTTDVIYNTIQDVVAERADIWYNKITAAVAAASTPASGATTLEEVLRTYVSWVSDDFYLTIKNEPIFKLYRTVIKLTGGVFLPIETLKMTAVWCLMRYDMQNITPITGPLIKRGTAHLAMCISMASHICTEGISSDYGQMITILSDNIPSKTKEAFYSFFERIGVLSVKKYLAWNKTVGVLLEKESLNMVGAMRMMTTFKMGRTFIRALTGNIKLGEYLKDLDPLPQKRTIHDVLTLFRIPSIYNRRVELITNRLDGLVQGKVTDSDIEFAAMCYYELLKLKLAYIPYAEYGKNGGIVDPCDAMVDLSLIDTIATHAFSKVNGGLFYGLKRRKFKSLLKERILNSPDQKYIEYFGEPKFILEVIQPITYE